MKTQVVLPDPLADLLKQMVPVRRRSHFIAEAVETRLRAIAFQQALRQAAGGWTARAHPAMKSQADINRYLARFRGRLLRRG